MTKFSSLFFYLFQTDIMVQEGLDDMTLLSKVTNEQIRDNLFERYKKDIIYTSISDVLISVNNILPTDFGTFR